MSLLEVRKNFVQYSCRYDLIVDQINYVDKGANFYINAGQDWLDRYLDISTATARYYYDLPLNSWYLLVPDLRVVEEVYLSDSNSKRRLRYMNIDMYKNRFRGNPTNIYSNSFLCEYYSVGVIRSVPQANGEIIIDKFGPNVISVPGAEFASTGILFSSPLGELATAEIWGKFYEKKLVLDTDQNKWSEIYPVVLSMAACRELEISYRNTVGVKDWETSIKAEMLGVELDYADKESTNVKGFVG